MAAEVRAGTERLDVFVSNAGIGAGQPDGRTRQTSPDGHELRFAVNYLAGFLLTLELLPLLRSSPPARVVNVASLGQHPLDFDDLMIEHGYSGTRAYGQSKLAQIMSGFELAGRVPATEVTVNSLHPATYMPTKIVLEEIGHQIDSGLQGGRKAAWFDDDANQRHRRAAGGEVPRRLRGSGFDAGGVAIFDLPRLGPASPARFPTSDLGHMEAHSTTPGHALVVIGDKVAAS